ncbi:MAG: crossover junction endodeoxyribonuclease RuvC [Verrucomicrobiales bacterium]|nr:crossover junction endodeoxyribonuclease RuvC [Verrucomicrobiales bacterium]
MRVLSIDPALRNTGYAIIERIASSRSPQYRALTYGVVKNHRTLRQSGCLVAIREQISDVIREYQPEQCAIEGVIFVQSYKTAITLGAARAASMIAAGEQGLEIFEYAPRRIKQAIVGRGAADKQQVAFMIRALLKLTQTPNPDEADALAIGLTHFYAMEANRPMSDQGSAI